MADACMQNTLKSFSLSSPGSSPNFCSTIDPTLLPFEKWRFCEQSTQSEFIGILQNVLSRDTTAVDCLSSSWMLEFYRCVQRQLNVVIKGCWGSGPGSRVLVAQTWRPKFNTHNPCKKLFMMVCTGDLNAREVKPGGSLGLAGQLTYPNRWAQVPVRDLVSKPNIWETASELDLWPWTSPGSCTCPHIYT